jgi:hypothetical protein
MCHCVLVIATPGLKHAKMISPVQITGVRTGNGLNRATSVSRNAKPSRSILGTRRTFVMIFLMEHLSIPMDKLAKTASLFGLI